MKAEVELEDVVRKNLDGNAVKRAHVSIHQRLVTRCDRQVQVVCALNRPERDQDQLGADEGRHVVGNAEPEAGDSLSGHGPASEHLRFFHVNRSDPEILTRGYGAGQERQPDGGHRLLSQRPPDPAGIRAFHSHLVALGCRLGSA